MVHLKVTITFVEPLTILLCDYENQLGMDEETLYKNLDSKTDKSKLMSSLNPSARLTAFLMLHPKSCEYKIKCLSHLLFSN